MIDWTNCPDVERIPGKVSGEWIVAGTRILVQGVIDNAGDCSPEQLAVQLYPGLGAARARRIIRTRVAMSRILLDQNVPAIVRSVLAGHDVSTAYEMAWSTLSNAELIAAADAADFGVLITADQNILRQHDVRRRKLAFVVLATHHWPSIKANANALIAAVNQAKEDRFQAMPLERLAGNQRRRRPPSDR